MLSTLYTHGHHLITAAGCAIACAATIECDGWTRSTVDVIGSISFISLTALSFVGTRKLGVAFIHSPSLYGTMGRGVVHAVVGIAGLMLFAIITDEAVKGLKAKGL